MARARLDVALLASALALGGCGTDIAQTAVRPKPSEPFDCQRTSEPVDLPTDPALGGGDALSDSPLIGGTYAAGQGPGIALVARDGFRLYQNEELVAERTASLDPVFVPLTFLPGDNVVSVVVTSPDRSPAVLVHVDELEREYPSDGTWKVSTSPDADFRLPSYDASDWEFAKDHGLAVATSGCAPPAGFIPSSTAHWIGVDDDSARTAVFRLEIPIAPLGFGRETTGGADAEPVVPADADELTTLLEGETPNVILLPEGRWNVTVDGPIEPACSLPCDDGSNKITYFAVSDGQTCEGPTRDIQRNERRFWFGSNKTLVGLGRGAILQGAWLTIENAENVIVRNVAVYDVNPEIIEAGDGVSINASSRVWLDHMTFRWIGDGFVDIADSLGITLSWIRFDGHSEFACQNHHPRANELSISQATIHHSFYDTVTGRAPQVNREGAEVHLANNVTSDDPDYAVGAACLAEILLEGSSFENVAYPTLRRDCTEEPAVGLIFAPAGSNYYDPATTGPHQLSGADSPEPRDAVFTLSYDLPLDSIVDVQGTVPLRAGAGSRWPLTFELEP
jgi:pectate lyase